ncbi:MAG: hypothetical protein K5930_06670 [Treponemataceae bacterium]|nr:hypothetical protein [Treponemataceae bacterium]
MYTQKRLSIDNKEAIKEVFTGVFTKAPWYSGTEYIINELCIRKERQGSGADTFFIHEIEKAIKELGLKQIFLLTDSQNKYNTKVISCDFINV